VAISNSSYWSAEASASRAARFGRFLLTWRKRSGWSQYEIPKWAEAAGFIGPAIGTVSQLERGKVSTPTMGLFAGLAEVNRRLVAKDYSSITDRKLLDRIQRGLPVLDADGKPWGFDQFVWAFHLPHQVTGEVWEASGGSGKPAPELTRAELVRVNDALAHGFRELLKEVRPMSKALQLAGKAAPPTEREAYEDALGGIGYDRTTLQQLWDEDAGEWAPLVWWQALQGGRRSKP
jgi:transcriptional regulator with XRE-family HTH domain